MRFLVIIITVLSYFQAVSQSVTDVFVKRTEGYKNYRIPSIVMSNDGTLLAFCEGRAMLLDHAENDIVLKRSSDLGKSWNELQVVASDSTNALNNPQAVVRSDGRIILMFQRYAEGFGERQAMPGLDGDRICKTFVTHSDNDGLTWSEPLDITADVKRAEATSMATGPGAGIELKKGKHKGRLVMPVNQGPWKNWFVYTVYSDDGGQTWQKGELAPYKKKVRGWANEVQMVELSDGRLMLNARSDTGNRKRKVAYSDDGGKTWSAVEDDKELLEPECQGSLIRFNQSTLLFCNPRHRTRRRRGTIYASTDDGATWPHRKTIYKQGFAYSSIVALSDKKIGVLFERDGYDAISFLQVDLADVLDPKLK